MTYCYREGGSKACPCAFFGHIPPSPELDLDPQSTPSHTDAMGRKRGRNDAGDTTATCSALWAADVLDVADSEVQPVRPEVWCYGVAALSSTCCARLATCSKGTVDGGMLGGDVEIWSWMVGWEVVVVAGDEVE